MNADSVKARLKNFAIKSGCTFQEVITYYGLERAIYRISISEYAEHFILKGGILQLRTSQNLRNIMACMYRL